MSQLIQMRQRMKAIETIKKITHAMRIISMSLHGRLKTKEIPLTHYRDGINGLFATLHNAYPQWHPKHGQQNESKKLIILIGSNKGLTGNFNTSLFKYLETQVPKTYPIDYIAIGKKAAEYIKQTSGSLIASYTDASFSSLFSITDEIGALIHKASTPYTSVIVVSNVIKNFFIQKPRKTVLIPFTQTDTPLEKAPDLSDYHWEQQPFEILDMLDSLRIKAELQYLIFESLLAEQAARFVSMDSSTRNATNLLDETKLQYNKLRQAKITKELTELTGSF